MCIQVCTIRLQTMDIKKWLTQATHHPYFWSYVSEVVFQITVWHELHDGIGFTLRYQANQVHKVGCIQGPGDRKEQHKSPQRNICSRLHTLCCSVDCIAISSASNSDLRRQDLTRLNQLADRRLSERKKVCVFERGQSKQLKAEHSTHTQPAEAKSVQSTAALPSPPSYV